MRNIEEGVGTVLFTIHHSPFESPPTRRASETTQSPPLLRPSSFALRPSPFHRPPSSLFPFQPSSLSYNPPNASSPPDPRRWECVRRNVLRLDRERHRRS